MRMKESGTMKNRIKILIVEDQDLIAQMFETMIGTNGEYHLAGRVKNADLAPVFCSKGGVDLVLMDVYTELGASGLDAAAVIKRDHPEIKIIIVTSMPEVSFQKRAREAGVESFWYKDGSELKLIDVIRHTLNGKSVYPLNTPRVKVGEVYSTDFTEKELSVLREIVRGSTNAEIAEVLCLSPATVKSYVNELMSKTGFRTRTALAVRARESGCVLAD